MSKEPHHLVKTLRAFSRDYSGPITSLLSHAADEIERLSALLDEQGQEHNDNLDRTDADEATRR